MTDHRLTEQPSDGSDSSRVSRPVKGGLVDLVFAPKANGFFLDPSSVSSPRQSEQADLPLNF